MLQYARTKEINEANEANEAKEANEVNEVNEVKYIAIVYQGPLSTFPRQRITRKLRFASEIAVSHKSRYMQQNLA